MERGFGGPVWHASIRPSAFDQLDALRAVAFTVLEGVGDPSAGEWVEQPRRILQLRRRLTNDEAARWAPELRDIRGTDEAIERARRVPTLALVPAHVIEAELARR